MGSIKPRTKSGKSGRHFSTRPDSGKRYRLILNLISYGYSDQQIRMAMQKNFPYTKQLASDDMRVLTYQFGWLKDLNPDSNKYKKHSLTASGRTVLDKFEDSVKKLSVSMENPRYMTTIQNTTYLKQFLSREEYGFEQNKNLKNVKTHIGRFDGNILRVFEGNKITMEITPQPTPVYNKDIVGAKKTVEKTILDLCNILNNTWELNLSIPRPILGVQHTVSDDFAKKVMRLTSGQQIKFKTEKGLVDINSSKGTEPRIEFEHIEQIREYLDIPESVSNVEKRLQDMEQKNNLRDSLLERVVGQLERNNDGIDRMANVLEKLTQVQSGQEQVRSLNSLSSNMFQ